MSGQLYTGPRLLSESPGTRCISEFRIFQVLEKYHSVHSMHRIVSPADSRTDPQSKSSLRFPLWPKWEQNLKKRVDICITESLCCAPEINTTL